MIKPAYMDSSAAQEMTCAAFLAAKQQPLFFLCGGREEGDGSVPAPDDPDARKEMGVSAPDGPDVRKEMGVSAPDGPDVSGQAAAGRRRMIHMQEQHNVVE